MERQGFRENYSGCFVGVASLRFSTMGTHLDDQHKMSVGTANSLILLDTT